MFKSEICVKKHPLATCPFDRAIAAMFAARPRDGKQRNTQTDTNELV